MRDEAWPYSSDSRGEHLSKGELTLEQDLELRLLADELGEYDRLELIEALLEERRLRLVEHQWFRIAMERVGIETCSEQEECPPLPETPQELGEILGRTPGEEEFELFINERMEAARMDEIDIEAIALGLED